MKTLLRRIILNTLLVVAVMLVPFGWLNDYSVVIIASILTIAVLLLIDYLGDWAENLLNEREK